MEVHYKRLWKLLIDLDMTKTDLRLQSGISSSTLAKMGKGGNLSLCVITKICQALDCENNFLIIKSQKKRKTNVRSNVSIKNKIPKDES